MHAIDRLGHPTLEGVLGFFAFGKCLSHAWRIDGQSDH